MKFIFIILCFPSIVLAQESNHKTADIISYVTVVSNLTLDTIHSYRSENRSDAFKNQAIRTSLTISISEIVKRIVHEARPDDSDNMSFPSEHTALSCVSVNVKEGKRFAIELPIAIGTAVGRVQAQKHFWWDVASGCGIGLLTGLIR